MSPFASYPSANAWIDTIVTRFKPSIDETALARTGLSGAAARTALLDLEQEILQHPNLIALAKKQRNASRPACSLPAEILASVVWFAQPLWRPTRYKSKYSLGWMLLSHVCSGWREAILASSELWRLLSCFNHPPRAIPGLLARCQQQTLELDFEIQIHGSEDPPHAMALCQTLMSPLVSQKIQSLRIFQSKGLFSRSGWLSLLRNHMPVLDILSITIYDIGATVTEDVILPVDIGAMPSPRLSSIALHGCRLPWISPLYNANIVTLKLSMLIWGQESLSSQSHFYNALERMPALKKLTLDNAFPIFTFEMDNMVRLQCLEQLKFRSSQSTITSALKTLLSFELPRELRCHIDLCGQGPPAEPDLISRAIAHVFQNPQEAPLALRISPMCFETMPFLEGTTKKRDRTLPGSQDVCTQLGSWAWSPNERCFEVSIDHERQLMPHLSLVIMSSLRHITVTADAMRHTAGADTWKEVFTPARQVQSLALNFTAPLSALLSALTDTTMDTNTQNACMSIFPALKAISLSYEYEDPEEVQAPGRIIVGEGDCLQLQFALLQFVHTRQRCTTRFEKLVVEEGILDPAILRQVAEIIEVEVF